MPCRISVMELILLQVSVCAAAALFALSPPLFLRFSLFLFPAMVSWHFFRTTSTAVICSGVISAIISMLAVVTALALPTMSLGSFPEVTIVVGIPAAFVFGCLVGGVARTLRRIANGRADDGVGPRPLLSFVRSIVVGYVIRVAVYFAGSQFV